MNELKISSSSIAFLLIIFLLGLQSNISYSKEESSVIIATVDNVKGNIDLNSVNTICNNALYDKFKFIGVPGELSIYNKHCVCEKYQVFQQLSMQSGEAFMKVIKDCKLNIQLQSIENATQVEVIKETGGYTIPDPEVEEEQSEIEKIIRDKLKSEKPSIFPNPVKSTLKLSYFNNAEYVNSELKIFDATGKEIELLIPPIPSDAGSHELTIDLSILQSGLYFYSFIRDANTFTGRLYKHE